MRIMIRFTTKETIYLIFISNCCNTLQCRAHDIFNSVAKVAVSNTIDQVVRVMAPTPFLENIKKKTVRRPHTGISEWANDLNSEQKHAVFDIVRKNHGEAPYCIYGPPGKIELFSAYMKTFCSFHKSLY